MLIEVCGIPGSGNSTLLKMVQKVMWANWNETKDGTPPELIDFRSGLIRSKIYNHLTAYHFPRLFYRKFERMVLQFASEYPNCEKRYIDRLLNLCYAVLQRETNKVLYVMDEGPVQYMSSIPHSDPLVRSNALKAAAEELLRPVDAVI